MTTSTVLVLVEHAAGRLAKVTGELLTAARALGEPVAVLFGAPEVDDPLVAELGTLGVGSVLRVRDARGTTYLATPAAEALAQLVARRQPSAVLLAATADGKEIAGRLAVLTESGLLTDITELHSDGTAVQEIFAGSTIVSSHVTVGTPIYAIKPGAIAPQPTQPTTPAVEELDVEFSVEGAQIVEEVTEPKGSRPELTDADVVVAGGRGVGTTAGFELIEQLADALGGAVGASRAATDGGLYPHQFQVGQTGKTVSPQLYIACGISGAIQHRAGMQTAQTIVVINADASSPIFEIADFGIVGDLHTVIPQALAALAVRAG